MLEIILLHYFVINMPPSFDSMLSNSSSIGPAFNNITISDPGGTVPLQSGSDIVFIDWILNMMPIICIIGVCTNLINIVVFLNPLLYDRSFKYMLANSISALIYLTFFIIDFYILKEFCDSGCDISYTHHAQMFFFLVDDYFSSVCAFFCILIDIILSMERLFVVKNKPYLAKIPQGIVIPFCLVISFGKSQKL